MARADFYADPQVYDVLHSRGTAAEVRVLQRMARHGSPASKRPVWLEPACGTGRYLIAAARLGLHAIGFDLSEDMVRYAQARAAQKGVAGNVSVFQSSMETFADAGHVKVASVHFAFNLINTIRHLDSDRVMLLHLGQMSRVLHPRGVYAVGISLSAYGLESITEDTWSGRRGGLRVDQVVQYLPAPSLGGDARRGSASRVERVVSHMTIHRGNSESHVDSTYALRSYNLSQWSTLINRSALAVHEVTDGFGEPVAPSEPGYFVFILKRRRPAH